MRTIITFIFFVLLASTAKAQTEFNFSCYDEEIAAIPDATYDDDNDQSDNYDRVAYINNIPTPDGFGIDANDEKIRIYEGTDSDSGNQVWPWNYDYNAYSYEDFNTLYRIIHRVLINLKYGYPPNTGTGL